MELGLELFTERCFNVEHGERASDVNEQSSESEPSSWTYPGNSERHQSKNHSMCRILPSARSENPIFGILYGTI